MKTQGIDYFLSTIFLTLLVLTSGLGVSWFVVPVSSAVFGDYHVVVDVLAFLGIYGLLSALVCRMIMKTRPLCEGDHDMESDLFTWWKLFTVVYEFGKGALLPFTTVFTKPLVMQLFGAKIGKDIALGGHLVDPQLITIEKEAIVGQGSVVTAHTITSGRLILSPVVLHEGATVGVNAIVMSGVTIGRGAVVTAGSAVPPNTTIPPFELWGGVPAKKIKSLNSNESD